MFIIDHNDNNYFLVDFLNFIFSIVALKIFVHFYLYLTCNIRESFKEYHIAIYLDDHIWSNNFEYNRRINFFVFLT